MNGYYLTGMHMDANHAGSKAQDDVSKILRDIGFLSIYIDAEQTRWEKFFFLKKNLNKKIAKMNKNEVFLVQYPLYMGGYFDKVITNLVTKSFKKSILFIHDISSLRKQESQKKIDDEIELFNNYKYVVAHNENMKKWLVEQGCTSDVKVLKIFDYLMSSNFEPRTSVDLNKFYFAGNLEKSSFIYNEIIDKRFNVFGINKRNNGKFIYRGVETPENLVKKLGSEEGLGIVWDGKEIEKSNLYTKYNDPHKASMYLASGFPLIVWDKSGLASFVKENNIGITVDSLKNINGALKKSDLKLIEKKVNSVSKKIRTGYFTRQVIFDIAKEN